MKDNASTNSQQWSIGGIGSTSTLLPIFYSPSKHESARACEILSLMYDNRYESASHSDRQFGVDYFHG